MSLLRRGLRGSAWLVLLAPLCVLFSRGVGYPYRSLTTGFSDLVISHEPYRLWVERLLFEAHSAPLWSPGILAGGPLAGNPLAGVWYPPGWLNWLLPQPFGYVFICGLHFAWGGLGMALWLSRSGLSVPTSLFGAVAFSLLTKLMAHYGAGHLSLVYAVPWTPWLLWAGLSAVRRGQFAWGSAGVLGVIWLADVRWGWFALLLWLWFSYSHSIRRFRLDSLAHNLPALRQAVLNLLAVPLFSTLLAAPLLLPLVEFVQVTTRSALQPRDSLAFSLPWLQLTGILLPDFGAANHEYVAYAGGAVLCLAVLGWLLAPRQVHWGWGGVALVSLGFALGENLPGVRWLVSLPGFSLLRVPARALFLFQFALIVLAAHGLNRSTAGIDARSLRRSRLALAALVGLGVGWLALGSLGGGKVLLPAAWGGSMLALSAAWIWAGLVNEKWRAIWLAGIISLTLIDLIPPAYSSFVHRPAEQVLGEGADLAAYLAEQPGRFRVYSPSYSLPQQTAAWYGLELADGVEPLQLAVYAEYMQSATGVAAQGYSVTIPPYSGGDPATANAGYAPDARALGLLNVRFVAAEYDLFAPGLRLLRRFGTTRLYENTLAQARAWVQPLELPLDAPVGEQIRPVTWLTEEPLVQTVQAAGPGRLVFSEIIYPGWQAYLDDQPVAIQPVQGLLRSVEVPAGTHQITLRYQPWTVPAGLTLGVLGWLGLLGGYWLAHKSIRLHRKSVPVS